MDWERSFFLAAFIRKYLLFMVVIGHDVFIMFGKKKNTKIGIILSEFWFVDRNTIRSIQYSKPFE